ncbi:GTPase family protein [uncultured Pseudoramibacter sp.]|uniref:GTPase family protein n=1 Tax=uncultured Pseudoramibacter sp. TaxID=1623493 RepID=UPI0025FDFE33|nr:GTPase [uncultured Pseudoramibacter sp.]
MKTTGGNLKRHLKNTIDEADMDAMIQQMMDQAQKKYDELKILNVMVLGKTGVGKSTLINNMFSAHLAETGVGKPVTKEIQKFEKPGLPLAIYDTPGLELDGSNALEQLLEDVTAIIKSGRKSGDVNQMVHCLWYCISTPSHRFESAEIEFLRRVSAQSGTGIPVIVVLTQSYSKRDAETMRETVEAEKLGVVDVVPVLAEPFVIDEAFPAILPYGLDSLAEVTYRVIPEEVREAFVVVGKDLALKKKRARRLVATASATAAGIGAVPIPGQDAAILIPEQISMLAGITVIYGMDFHKSDVIAVIGPLLATITGRTIVAELPKLIPGAGTAAGSVISAATAASLTSALGETTIIILEKMAKGEIHPEDLKNKKGVKAIKKIFFDQLKQFKR